MSEAEIQWDDDDDIQWDDDNDNDTTALLSEIKTESKAPAIVPAEELERRKLEASRIASRKRYFFYRRVDQLEQYTLDLIKTKYGLLTAFVASMSGQFNVGSPIDLEILASSAPNAELDRTRRASAHINLRHPGCSVQVNPGGHVSILGVTSCSDMYLAARRIARLIQVSGACPAAKFTAFDINNIVLSTKMPFTFRLSSTQNILVEMGLDASFFEDLFPCVKIEGTFPHKNSVKVFHSGSVTIMGLKTLSACIQAVDYYYHILKEVSERIQSTTQTVKTFGRYQTRILPTDTGVTSGGGDNSAGIGGNMTNNGINQQNMKYNQLSQPEYASVSMKLDVDGTPLDEEDDFVLEHG